MKSIFSLILILFLIGCNSTNTIEKDDSLSKIQEKGFIRWGCDTLGTMPFSYTDPNDPSKFIGFEVDIINEIAKRLNVKVVIVRRKWDKLIEELLLNSFDIAMNGIEDKNRQKQLFDFSYPYYVYSQQITVRKDNTDIHSLKDLRNKTVSTISNSAAENILRTIPDVKIHITTDIKHNYRLLEDGMVDAVIIDNIMAIAYAEPNPKLKNVGETFEPGLYVIALRTEDVTLNVAISKIIIDMIKDGTLKAILEKWNLMNHHQTDIGIF